MKENPIGQENANPPPAGDLFAVEAETAFREFVLRREFPCVGAKAAFNSDSYSVGVYEELGNDNNGALAAALYDFTQSTLISDPHSNFLPQGQGTHLFEERRGDDADTSEDRIPFLEGEGRVRASEYATFVAIFERPREVDEIVFERLFWKQLRALHDHDAARFEWDPHVSADPADPHFSFSFAGQALYVIGMHANSSREARRFPWPALVFNPHEQFERLRADGKWKRIQETIRSRDLELQGSINPMLSDFGEKSEARQYSGRAVEDNWEAPFPGIERKCPFAH
jgi:FPC/CPF motif-containing protein YcgG